MSVRLRTKWLWVQIPLLSLRYTKIHNASQNFWHNMHLFFLFLAFKSTFSYSLDQIQHMLILSGHKVPYITHTKNANCKYYLVLTKIYFQIFGKFKQNNSHLFLRNQFWWFQGNSSQLIHLSLLNILRKIWRWYLKILKPAFFPNSEREFLTNPSRWQEYHFWIIKDNTKAYLKNYIWEAFSSEASWYIKAPIKVEIHLCVLFLFSP